MRRYSNTSHMLHHFAPNWHRHLERQHTILILYRWAKQLCSERPLLGYLEVIPGQPYTCITNKMKKLAQRIIQWRSIVGHNQLSNEQREMILTRHKSRGGDEWDLLFHHASIGRVVEGSLLRMYSPLLAMRSFFIQLEEGTMKDAAASTKGFTYVFGSVCCHHTSVFAN